MTTRVVNLRKEKFDVYIGRPGRGQHGFYGNPFSVEEHGRERALRLYRDYFNEQIRDNPHFREMILALRGKTLGCFCAPSGGFRGRLLCHGQVIAGFLDGVPPEKAGGGAVGTAVLDPTGKYRYALTRCWDERTGRVTFVMLNPSVADAQTDDPTIKRCVNFARSWGFGSMAVVNLFALRATDPSELKLSADPVGPDNDAHIVAACRGGGAVVAAWGEKGDLYSRDKAVLKILPRPIHAIALTGRGMPAHPLYQKSILPMMEWVA